MKKRYFAVLALALTVLFVSCEERTHYSVAFTGIEREAVLVPVGKDFTVPADIPAKEHYSLRIMYGSSEVLPGDVIKLDRDITIKCYYILDDFTVSFAGINRPSVEVKYGSTFTVPSDIEIPEGNTMKIMLGEKRVFPGNEFTVTGDTVLTVTFTPVVG